MTRSAAFCITLLLLSVSSCLGYPIVTCPTATMVSDKLAYLDYYWIETKAKDPNVPDEVQIGAAYLGMTERFEFDVTSVKFGATRYQTVLTPQYLVFSEKSSRPALAIGLEDITRELGDRVSFYAAAAKTITPMTEQGPVFPSVRLDLGYGTEPRSAWFGGVELGICQGLLGVAISDGLDSIYAFCYTVPKTTFSIAGGTLGNGHWIGIEYGVWFK